MTEEPKPLSFAEEIEYIESALLININACEEMIEKQNYNFIHLPDECQTKEGATGFLYGLYFAVEKLQGQEIRRIIDVIRKSKPDNNYPEQTAKICEIVKSLGKQHEKVEINS